MLYTAASLCAAITSCSIKVLHQVLLITKSLTVAAEHSYGCPGLTGAKIHHCTMQILRHTFSDTCAEKYDFIFSIATVCLNAVGQC